MTYTVASLLFSCLFSLQGMNTFRLIQQIYLATTPFNVISINLLSLYNWNVCQHFLFSIVLIQGNYSQLSLQDSKSFLRKFRAMKYSTHYGNLQETYNRTEYFYLFIMDIYIIKFLSRYRCFHRFYYPKNKKIIRKRLTKQKQNQASNSAIVFASFFLKYFLLVGWYRSSSCVYIIAVSSRLLY